MLRRWASTVLTLSTSSSAISRLVRPAAASSAISRSRAVRPPSSWLGERGARQPRARSSRAAMRRQRSAPARSRRAAASVSAARAAARSPSAARAWPSSEAGAGGGEGGDGDLRLRRPLRRAGGVARREQRLRLRPGDHGAADGVVRARRCGSLPRLHEVGVGGGALAGRKGREALATDRGPDRLRALGRVAAGHERVAARPPGLAAGLEVGPLAVLGCLIGRAQRPGRVARRQPRRRQRAVRPDVHGRAAQQPGELGRLLGSGERGLDAPELDQQPRRLGAQDKQDRRAAAGPRQPLAALEVLETDGEPAKRPVGARQHP